MVEQQFSKLMTRVRFPSPAPSASAKASAGLFSARGGSIFSAGGGCPAVALYRRSPLAEADGEGGPTNMTFVYLLQSQVDTSKHYVGISSDPARRLEEHNSGQSIHTNKHRPWKTNVVVGFTDATKATAFERYLKSGSGRAFSKKHF